MNTTVLASFAASLTATPAFADFVVAYLTAAVLSLLGAVLIRRLG
jgi:hypothetical protein